MVMDSVILTMDDLVVMMSCLDYRLKTDILQPNEEAAIKRTLEKVLDILEMED